MIEIKMSDYYLDVVDEKDEVVGKELKSKKSEMGFISRVVAAYLIDSEKKFLMCKRAAHKDDAADLWDLAVCGNVENFGNWNGTVVFIQYEIDKVNRQKSAEP